MTSVAVVGAGLFGCVIATHLRKLGAEVTLIDDERQNSGSKPAACLMKPSWYSGLGKDIHEPALNLLDELYGVQELSFKIIPSGLKTKVFHVSPKQILQRSRSTGKVLRLIEGTRQWHIVRHVNSAFLSADKVVLATGVWANELLPEDCQITNLRPQWGAAFRAKRTFLNTIRVWAPYRQLVTTTIDGCGWVGDGTAVKEWTPERAFKSINRCSDAVSLGSWDLQPSIGMRPYVRGAKPCYLAQPHPGLWVATGGAKNGTIAAAWAALQIGNQI